MEAKGMGTCLELCEVVMSDGTIMHIRVWSAGLTNDGGYQFLLFEEEWDSLTLAPGTWSCVKRKPYPEARETL